MDSKKYRYSEIVPWLPDHDGLKDIFVWQTGRKLLPLLGVESATFWPVAQSFNCWETAAHID